MSSSAELDDMFVVSIFQYRNHVDQASYRIDLLGV